MNPKVCLSRGSRASTSFASSTWWLGDGHEMRAGEYFSSVLDSASSTRRRVRANVLGGTANSMLKLLNSIEPT
ncbi:hypothetical protein PR003_g34758 [Phytophthora rubi]|uniref:Uncharacterized protein n=1 Tax=Phytophthora rubi TaxID=129364 RepID=A0A6A4ARK6_9STRA|nr:hypothetical protein PR003_g34758 [Phytophthora rubi]